MALGGSQRSEAEGGAAQPFRPAGLVTLLTDFGLVDTYVGVMHGVIHSRAPELRVVDLAHGIEPQNVIQAGWCLARAYPFFPRGSVHVAVVDPGVGSERRILVAEHAGHAFLAPDNGLLELVLGTDARVRVLDGERFGLERVSRTFHGRDLFAPAAAALASGTPFDTLGPEASEREPLDFVESEPWSDGGLATRVLYVDRFGNLVTPLRLAPEDLGLWSVEVSGVELPLLATYAEVATGEALALIGSSETLEISVRDGSARETLDATTGTPVRLRRKEAR